MRNPQTHPDDYEGHWTNNPLAFDSVVHGPSVPTESWWARPMSREAFAAEVAKRQPQLMASRFGRILRPTFGADVESRPYKPKLSLFGEVQA